MTQLSCCRKSSSFSCSKRLLGSAWYCGTEKTILMKCWQQFASSWQSISKSIAGYHLVAASPSHRATTPNSSGSAKTLLKLRYIHIKPAKHRRTVAKCSGCKRLQKSYCVVVVVLAEGPFITFSWGRSLGRLGDLLTCKHQKLLHRETVKSFNEHSITDNRTWFRKECCLTRKNPAWLLTKVLHVWRNMAIASWPLPPRVTCTLDSKYSFEKSNIN